MKHEEFEKQMIDRVNQKCDMQDLDRQEVARAAAEEYRYILKCKKANAVLGIIVWVACFATITFAMAALNWLGHIPVEIAVAVTAVFSLVAGMNVNALATKIKNGGNWR